MNKTKRVAWARGDEARRQKLSQTIEPRDHLQVLSVPALPSEIALVWNPTGTGRLRRARFPYGPNYPSSRTGGPELLDQWIALDDVALLHWRYAACPTCEQLVRAAIQRPDEVHRLTSAVHSLTCETLDHEPARSVPALAWLFALLPAGLYTVTLDVYVPTTGDDKPTWGAYSKLELCPALREIYRHPRPRYLVPTQRDGAFRPDAWQRAQESFQTHPGLALYLAGVASLLLDGHHRALAAAARHLEFLCITVAPARVARVLPDIGQSCTITHAPIVEVSTRNVRLEMTDLPPRLAPWLTAAADCSDIRWIWDHSVVEGFKSIPRALNFGPLSLSVDIAGVYGAWRDLPTIYDPTDDST